MWGVVPFRMPMLDSIEAMTAHGEARLLAEGLVAPGDEIIVLGGNGPIEGTTCFVKFHVVGKGDTEVAR